MRPRLLLQSQTKLDRLFDPNRVQKIPHYLVQTSRILHSQRVFGIPFDDYFNSMPETNNVNQAKLFVLQRQYFQLVEPAYLSWPEDITLKDPGVQAWIFDELFDLDKIQYSPPDRYRYRVLKCLVSKLERSMTDPEEDEISDDLMSALSVLIGSNMPSELMSAQQTAYVTYTYPRHSSPDEDEPKDHTVTILESRYVISSSGTTGLRTWDSALVLGAYLSSEHGLRIISGKKVFELGAGTGMLSILCAKHLGASGVVATDGDEAVVDAIKTNSFLNGVDTNESSNTTIRTAALRWGWPLNAATFAEDFGMEVPDVLLGADVTYDRTMNPALVSSLREFFELNSALQVLISAIIRDEQTFETFLNACRRNGFSLDLVDFPLSPEQRQDGPFYSTSTPIKIWRITRSQPPADPFAF